jgi:dipeptidyl aminopeptidase/acylaminoacyl peptidase
MILSEEDLKLSERQIKFIESGWGIEVVNDTIVRKIIYESDNLKVKGFIAHPKNTDKKYPLIIWNRGGNRKDGMIDDFLAKGIFGEIASWGYVVLASQYREGDEFGGSDVNDVINLIPLADEIPFCDSEMTGMEGWSRGGMMTYRVLSMTERIRCAVIISGLADLFRNEEIRSDLAKVYEKLFGSEDENEFKKRKQERSAVYFADRINKSSKILLIHGTADKKVSHLDSVDMYEKLKSNGIFCELKLIENGDHYLKRQRKEIVKYRRDWYERFLKN